MKLADYMKTNKLDDAAFATQVKRDRTTVMRWRKQLVRPDWDSLAEISAVTDGAVTATDFMQPAQAAE